MQQMGAILYQKKLKTAAYVRENKELRKIKLKKEIVNLK